LRDIPRGRPVGIPGAPATLPDKASLLGVPWAACTGPRTANSVQLATQVTVGQVPAGGAALGADEGLLISNAGNRYLIWHDHRLRVPGNDTIAALDWAGIRPAPVTAAFLDAIPPGPDLAPPTVPGDGERSSRQVGGQPATVGQLYRVGNSYYLMVSNGLAHIGQLAAKLLTAAGRSVTQASTQDVGRVLVDTQVEPAGLPQTVPAARGADDRFAMACAVYRGPADPDKAVTVVSYATVAPGTYLTDDTPPPGAGADGTPLADRIGVPGGRGALVATLLSPGVSAPGNVYLLTDSGIKYPLPQTDLAKVETSLGYDKVTPVRVPDLMLALIPSGPALDPQAATLFVPQVVVTPSARG
jgi:type VII secretion protein EccB